MVADLRSELLDSVRRIAAQTSNAPNVRTLSAQESADGAEPFGTPTAFGSRNYVSSIKNLSTAVTVYLGSPRVETEVLTQKKREIKRSAPDTIRRLEQYLARVPLVRLCCRLGDHSTFTPSCSFVVSTYRKDCLHLAHMVAMNLFPAAQCSSSADLTVIAVPEWPEKERQVLVFPEVGVTFVLGSDYFGEIKNAFLRMAMWLAKDRGMLGLHAGTQIIHARTSNGALRKLGVIMFGITSTGKTTHSCHNHGLDKPGEMVQIAQDDVVFWCADGSALGSERAFYIKTEGLNPDEQPLLYAAATAPEAILENVFVDFNGCVCFEDRTITPNAHALAPREVLGSFVADSINLPPVSELDRLILLFMVRDYTVVPIASRLTPEQATVAFMLSESIDAVGAEQQPGSPPGGIGASPYVIGDAAVDCNRFYELVKAHGPKIECYMLNTGGVGELVEHELDGGRKVRRKVTRITIPEMAAVIRAIARDSIKWREDPNWMVETPAFVEGMDISRFELDRHYEQDKIDFLIAEKRVQRLRYAEQYAALNPAVRAAAEF
ncbi:MAG: phosphoenolpyruvate carboxykinase (ATP) [Armatimonadota bacterium]|nr:phosphoenolpyruvate carboxykinase (ATP) [Armatimonadota bacterium]